MHRRPLGKTGMTVSALGFGGGPLGDDAMTDATADRLIHTAIDRGINIIDTAPSYGSSERRIGRVLASMSNAARDAIIIATKGGYGVPGVGDWTPEVLERGVDRALRQLDTDRIDLFLLHSCERERLARGDLILPLERLKAAGKVRAVGYSGDGDALRWAVSCAAFDVVECSVNLVDQEALAIIAGTTQGVLAKRSLAGAAWVDAKSAYVDRWRTFSAHGEVDTQIAWDELSLRFAAFAKNISSALFGTRRSENLVRAIECAERGALPENAIAEIHRRFDPAWHGLI